MPTKQIDCYKGKVAFQTARMWNDYMKEHDYDEADWILVDEIVKCEFNGPDQRGFFDGRAKLIIDGQEQELTLSGHRTLHANGNRHGQWSWAKAE